MHMFKHAIPMVSLASQWTALGAISVNEAGLLEEPFLHFEAGTPREAVWTWFKDQNPAFDLEDAMEGELVEDMQKIQQMLAFFRWANVVMVDGGDQLVTEWHCIRDDEISGNPNAWIARFQLLDGDWLELTEWSARTAAFDLEDKAVWTTCSEGESLQLRFHRLEAANLDAVLSHPAEPLRLQHTSVPVPDIPEARALEDLRNGVVGARRLG